MASIFRGSGRASCSSNSYLHICFSKSSKMDAIRKKMQSLKSETDSLYSIIHNFEEETKESNRRSDQADCDIRDYGKKVHGLEIEFDETGDKLQKAAESLEEKEKMYREVEGDVSALSRRIMLMEEEAKKSEENLAGTVTKLATTSKEADNILKKVKAVESTCMNNEVTLEELDKNPRASTKMATDNEQKLDELSRKLGVQEEGLKGSMGGGPGQQQGPQGMPNFGDGGFSYTYHGDPNATFRQFFGNSNPFESFFNGGGQGMPGGMGGSGRGGRG